MIPLLTTALDEALLALLAPLQLPQCDQLAADTDWHLCLADSALVLRSRLLPKQGDIQVDFASAAATHRRKFGGGKSEDIVKAVGLNKKPGLTVIDATAGLARDAFVLASQGARLILLERNPAVAALLTDGLRRAAQHPELAGWLPERMQLRCLAAVTGMQQAIAARETVDVVFLDPMYPAREKSALVKKEMRAFHDVVGSDEDADALLAPALALARHRVVVKRPSYAGFLADQPPTMSITGKNNRFDVYVNAAF